MLPEAALASFMAALFSMMNPLGNVGVFASMIANRSEAHVGSLNRKIFVTTYMQR